MTLQICRAPSEIRATTAGWRQAGLRVGFVPTMGALHQGHISLVGEALSRCQRVVVSIFVNPTQFGPNEDFARYPRDEFGDLTKLESAGAHAVFLPSPPQIYPPDHETRVSVGGLASRLCGASRPGHFTGVATVCTKLFGIVNPDVAVFGEKDWQQLQVIRRVVEDLWLPVQIVGGTLMRAPDGLALSSRNALLSPEARNAALAIPRALTQAQAHYAAGHSPRDIERATRAELESAGGQVDYAEVVDANTLEPLSHGAPQDETPARLMIAAWFGGVRLIDNGPLAASV